MSTTRQAVNNAILRLEHTLDALGVQLVEFHTEDGNQWSEIYHALRDITYRMENLSSRMLDMEDEQQE